jgi:hypothetical protein
MAGGIYGLFGLINDVHAAWYKYVLAILFLPLGTAILIRTLWSYKRISIGKGKIHVHYPVRMRHTEFSVKEIISWKEESIKTASGTYRELQIKHSTHKTLDISMQEHSRYKETLKYLKSKCAGKQIRI